MKKPKVVNFLDRLASVTANMYAEKISEFLFAPLPFKVGKDRRSWLRKLSDNIGDKIYDFRIWLGEKIAGQSFDYED